ncbi:Uncharacterised protein [Bordetella pertussis]|nr:Uncharacterised protein [Bordetella pertussis]
MLGAGEAPTIAMLLGLSSLPMRWTAFMDALSLVSGTGMAAARDRASRRVRPGFAWFSPSGHRHVWRNIDARFCRTITFGNLSYNQGYRLSEWTP